MSAPFPLDDIDLGHQHSLFRNQKRTPVFGLVVKKERLRRTSLPLNSTSATEGVPLTLNIAVCSRSMMHPIDSVIIAKINHISQLFKFNFYSS